MHWKLKAAIQNAVSVLPASVSYPVYFWIQRNFGGLRRIDPVERLAAGVETWKRISALGYDPTGRVFMEIGTGRVPLVPLAYWLMGAGKTVTIDLNPYLRPELIRDSIEYIHAHEDEIDSMFGPLMRQDRKQALLRLRGDAFSTAEFLDRCCIDYLAPGDAADTGLPARSIDFHTSYTVLEHIPPGVLQAILREGSRIISDDGLFLHRIDYSDHFSHSDRTISPINFLQYSDRQWDRYAGNRYMYVNRLRHDDYLGLFEAAGHVVVADDHKVDPQSKQLLSGGFRVDERFRSKPERILSIKGAWIASRARAAAAAPASHVTAKRRAAPVAAGQPG